jgi:hypothetical protein
MIGAKMHKPLSPLNGGNNYGGAKVIMQYVEFAKGGNTHNIGTLVTLCKDM